MEFTFDKILVCNWMAPSIEVLSSWSLLQSLEIRTKSISTLQPLARLSRLTSLDLACEILEDHDLSCLRGKPLKHLMLENDFVNEGQENVLASLTSLQSLD